MKHKPRPQVQGVVTSSHRIERGRKRMWTISIMLLSILLAVSMQTTVVMGQSGGPEITSFSASPTGPVMVGTEVTLAVEVSGGGMVVDQSSVSDYLSGVWSPSMGQTFTPASNNLASVEMEFCVWFWPSAVRTVTLEIFDGPWWEGAALLDSSTVTAELYPIWNWEAVPFEFDDPIPVTPGQLYWMRVLTPSDVIVHMLKNVYPYGKAVLHNTPQTYQDLWFKTYTRTDPQVRFSTDGGASWTSWTYETTHTWTTAEQDIGANTLLAQATDGVTQVTSDPIQYEVIPTIPWAMEDIEEEVANRGIQTSLTTKLQKAAIALEQGDARLFENLLDAFINEAEAQSGKMIEEGYAVNLVSWATGWMQLLA